MLSGLNEPLVDAEDCQVIGFSATAGKDDLRGAASHQGRNGLARSLHCRSRLLSMMMDGRRVPKVLPEVRPHGLKDRGQHGCGGVIVEIDAAHGCRHFTLYR